MASFNLPNSDRLFGIAAFFISMGTFCVYIYEARLLQKQQYASALPYLEMWHSGGTSNYRLILVNNGIGPAFVQGIKIHYHGKIYKMDHVAFYDKVRSPTDTARVTNTNLYPGQVIPAGREVELFKVYGSQQAGKSLRRLFSDKGAKIEIIYASVYEERWQLKGLGNPPYKLED